MQTACFISEYILLGYSHQMIPTSQKRFDAGASFSGFDFEINF